MLTAQDRCDTCGSQALWSAWLGGTELLYCNHHFRKYETNLRAKADAIVDHTYQTGWL